MRMQRLAGVAVVAVMLAYGLATAAPMAEAQPESRFAARAAGYRPESEECAALAKINAFRRKHGRGELTLSPTLGAAAEHHSADMAAKDYFSHDFQGGPTWDRNIRDHGYDAFPIGENIAAGMSSAAGAVKAWKHSPEHRRGMLDRDYRAVGVGRTYDGRSTYGYYWTTDFGGVVDEAISCR